MIEKVKRMIVIALESSCGLTGHHFCHRLAVASAKLDMKWNTAVWSDAVDEDGEIK